MLISEMKDSVFNSRAPNAPSPFLFLFTPDVFPHCALCRMGRLAWRRRHASGQRNSC